MQLLYKLRYKLEDRQHTRGMHTSFRPSLEIKLNLKKAGHLFIGETRQSHHQLLDILATEISHVSVFSTRQLQAP